MTTEFDTALARGVKAPRPIMLPTPCGGPVGALPSSSARNGRRGARPIPEAIPIHGPAEPQPFMISPSIPAS